MELNLDSGIFIGFLVVTLALGLASSRGVTNIREYAIGNRNFNTATIVATIVATWVGGDVFYVTITESYKNGLNYVWINLLGDFTVFLLIGLFFAPRIGEFLGKLSIAEAMGGLFGQKVRIITAIAGFIAAIGTIAIEFKLAGMVFGYTLNISDFIGTIIAATVVTLYASLGGIKSVTFTDIIQFFTFGVVIPIVSYILLTSIDNINIVTNLLTSSPLFNYKEVFDFSKPLPFKQLFLFLFFIIPAFGPAIFQRIAMARDPKQVKKSFVIAAIAGLIVSSFISWIAVLILSLEPSQDPNDALKKIIFGSSHIGLKGMMLAGIAAMVMSTVDSSINSASILMVHDILNTLKIRFNRKELISARIVSVFIGVFSLILSLRESSLLELIVITCSFYMPIVTVPFIMALIGFRSSEKSVILGMIAGLLTVLIWDYVLQIKVANSIPIGMLANLIVLMGSHYLLKQAGGWVGIKDDSELVNTRKERKRKWQKFIKKIQSFTLIQFCKNNSPQGDGLISILGFFVMISVFGSTHTLAKIYQREYSTVINVFYPMTLCSTSILMAYPLWLEPWRRTNLIYLFWQIIAFFVLICFSFLMVLISNFSELQLMVFMVNVIVISSFSKWQWSLFSIVAGVLLATFSFIHYYPEALSEVGLLSSQFKVVYLLMLVSSSLILFLKPKQEYQELTEEKVDLLSGRVTFQEKEIQKALAVKGEFIRNISHEYHAPMTGIYSMTESLIAGYHRFDDKTKLGALKTILDSALRLEVFDSNISSLSQLSKGKYELNLEKIDLSNMLYDHVELVRKAYEENPNDREFYLDIEGNIFVNADKFYLGQAIDNLIINTINYCKKGKINITLKKHGEGVEFTISDDGIGIPKEDLYDIFAEFTTSSRTRTLAGGRGVGLAVCKRVIEAHGGTISAESDGVKGATISFTLPLPKQ